MMQSSYYTPTVRDIAKKVKTHRADEKSIVNMITLHAARHFVETKWYNTIPIEKKAKVSIELKEFRELTKKEQQLDLRCSHIGIFVASLDGQHLDFRIHF